MHASLKDNFSQYSNEQFETYFNMMFSIYSLPNIILPVFSGLLAVKYGVRKAFIVNTLFLVIGQIIVAYGCNINSIYTMLTGRMIMGFGGENMSNCQTGIIIKWFAKKDLPFAQGILISFMRVGSVLVASVAPKIVSVY